MFNYHDIYWFAGLLFYNRFITPSPKSKAFLCIIATTLSGITIATHYPLLLTNPNYQGDFIVNSTNAFMRQYLFSDLYNVLFVYKILRTDMVIHHIFALLVFFTNSNLNSAYATFGEILSIFPFFTDNQQIILPLRFICIFPIRTLLWSGSIAMSYHSVYANLPIASNANFYICIIVLGLDVYWGYKIFKIINRF